MTSNENKISYASYNYPHTHWAMFTHEDATNFAKFKVKLNGQKLYYSAYINPTDARWYRTIVKLVDPQKNSNTFNRPLTFEETHGLMTVAAGLFDMFQNMSMLPQISIARNNSIEEQNGIMIIGKKNEPAFGHAHVMATGVPGHEYIPEVPLEGPLIGDEINLKGNDPNKPGGLKIKWSEEKLEKARDFLNLQIGKWLQSQKPYFNTLNMEIEIIADFPSL